MDKPQFLTVIQHGNRVIGTATVTHADMGVLIGDFEPGEAYNEIRHVFLRFAAAAAAQGPEAEQLARGYYHERDALALHVLDVHGELVPGVVHIIDLSDEPRELVLELYPM